MWWISRPIATVGKWAYFTIETMDVDAIIGSFNGGAITEHWWNAA